MPWQIFSPWRCPRNGPRKQNQKQRLYLEPLEDRTSPSAEILSSFRGLGYSDTAGYEPPDTQVAVGPNHVVATVNTTIRISDKAGNPLLTQDLSAFFSPLSVNQLKADPVVTYDEVSGRFIIGVLDITPSFTSTDLLYAVSDSSDPTADTNGDGRAFSEMRRIDFGSRNFGDFPRLGWNADAVVFTVNVFRGNTYTGVRVVNIAKTADFFDGNPNTGSVTTTNLSATTHYTLVPSVMHGSVAGDPMWLVEESSQNNDDNLSRIRVVKMTLGATPTFTSTDLSVNAYTPPPEADQPGSPNSMTTNGEASILNAEWRGGRLVASHIIGLSTDGAAHVRWYEFNTNTALPTLTQQGTFYPGSTIDTYFPAIAIAANGTIGLTFMQSSATQYVSMYVTIKTLADPPGIMETPVLVQAGQDTYAGSRAGDFAGISVDPTNDTFWGANEYIPANDFWGTFVANFSLPALSINQLIVTEPSSGTLSAVFTISLDIVSTADVTVAYATADGTTTAGNDYNPTSGTLTIPAGQLSNTVTVTVKADALLEGTETAYLILSNPQLAFLRGSVGRLTIRDNPLAGTANQRYVATLYFDLLQRPYDPGGLANWTSLLDQGFSRSQVASMIESSTEFRQLMVRSLYRKYLLRDADPSGLNGFTVSMNNGATIEQIAAAILGSAEYFQTRGGSTVNGFLHALYADVLHRPIDPSGLSNWTQAIQQSATRAQVATSVLGSDEFRAHLINFGGYLQSDERPASPHVLHGFYQLLLRRNADPNGFNSFLGALRSGARDEAVIATIVGSAEYGGLV